MASKSEPTPDAKLAEMGAEIALGLDIPRLWVTGAQSFATPDFTLIVFREQLLVPDAQGQQQFLIKNVASVVMPTGVAREFHSLLGQALAVEEGDQGATE